VAGWAPLYPFHRQPKCSGKRPVSCQRNVWFDCSFLVLSPVLCSSYNIASDVPGPNYYTIPEQEGWNSYKRGAFLEKAERFPKEKPYEGPGTIVRRSVGPPMPLARCCAAQTPFLPPQNPQERQKTRQDPLKSPRRLPVLQCCGSK